VTGGPVPLTVPYLFVAGDQVIYDVIPLNGSGFDGVAGEEIPAIEQPLAIRVLDYYGAPVAGAAVQWAVNIGSGSFVPGAGNTTNVTDQNGVAIATPVLGPELGLQEFAATVGSIEMLFDGNARLAPSINAGGIVDGAGFAARAVAPGSIVSVFGANMSDVTDGAFYLPLPAGLDNVSVSFDVPSANISVPGRFFYVSPTQLNIQVPWELEGQSSAIVKVIIGETYSAEYTLPLAAYGPGFFAYNSGSQLMALALDTSYHLITPSNSAKRGGVVQLYLGGLGPVSKPPASGAAALDNPLSQTVATPTITIGGQTANVLWSGLAPGFVGLYQVDATVPDNAGTGLQPATCSVGGVACQTVMLPLE
jgi:minor extracellular serine protease Vpr